MSRISRSPRILVLGSLAALGGLIGCGSEGTVDPGQEDRIRFSVQEALLSASAPVSITLRNDGGRALGPVEIGAFGFRDQAGSPVPGVDLRITPAEVATLNPGQSVDIEIEPLIQGSLQPGLYDGVLEARVGPDVRTQISYLLEIETPTAFDEAREIEITGAPGQLFQGEPAGIIAEVRDQDGAVLQGPQIQWRVVPAGSGIFGTSGQFVPFHPGTVRIVAEHGALADTVTLSVVPRGLGGHFSQAGHGGRLDRWTSDLWVHGNFAYTGSVGTRDQVGNAVNTWDVSDPTAPVLLHTLTVEARRVNDVKVRADGQIGIATHENDAAGKNGFTVLDLSDPTTPRPIARVTRGLESGVHNTWIEGRWLYVVVDGVGNGLRIYDLVDPEGPTEVARFADSESFLHDVYVRDGLAFLSHWNSGLIVLDVGNGMRGGSPNNPVEVSRIRLDGETHNAWYWPERKLVFVGEEDFGVTRGILHVVDLSNPSSPREVATYRIAGETPHNFWLDEAEEVLYASWYSQGVLAIDVSGQLMGPLELQGRTFAQARYGTGSQNCYIDNVMCSWAPQLHRGRIFTSDMSQGLVVLDVSLHR